MEDEESPILSFSQHAKRSPKKSAPKAKVHPKSAGAQLRGDTSNLLAKLIGFVSAWDAQPRVFNKVIDAHMYCDVEELRTAFNGEIRRLGSEIAGPRAKKLGDHTNEEVPERIKAERALVMKALQNLSELPEMHPYLGDCKQLYERIQDEKDKLQRE